MMKRFLLIFLSALSFGFAQTPAQTDGSENVLLSEDDLMLLQMLLTNDLFRENFVQSCTVGSIDWLGAEWSGKTCSCAYDNLSKNASLLMKFLNTDDSGNGNDLDKLSFDLLEKCLPKQFPKEMESAVIKECMNGGVKKIVCDCVMDNVKKKYTVKTFMKRVMEDSNSLETEMTQITSRCSK